MQGHLGVRRAGKRRPLRHRLRAARQAHDLKAKLGGTDTVTAVLLGGNVSGLADTLYAYGAEQVILAEHPNLAQYSARPYEKVLVELANKHKPSIFLFAASPIGRDVAPRVMCGLRTGLTADAIDLDVDEDGVFVQTTPNFGGNILSHIVILEKRPQMVTVHPKVFEPLEPRAGATGELITESVEGRGRRRLRRARNEHEEVRGASP